MKTINSTKLIDIVPGTTITCVSRVVTVTGPLGTITRSFKHLNLDIAILAEEQKLRVDLWFGNRKALACIRTVTAHIANMMTGCTQGFLYKMRFCYAHFPINVTLVDNAVEIRNFLGEKRVRRVKLLPGVEFVRTKDVKDQIELSGIDITAVSLSAAQIQQATSVRRKDIRKFLDGIYVSWKGAVPVKEE